MINYTYFIPLFSRSDDFEKRFHADELLDLCSWWSEQENGYGIFLNIYTIVDYKNVSSD
jgi:hypothetical protein